MPTGKHNIGLIVTNADVFVLAGKTTQKSFEITHLKTQTDYEFFVALGEEKSAVRLERTGKTVGYVVNYLHPDDTYYDFSGKYLCLPSLVRHPDGFWLASMDLFKGGYPQNLTLIFRSDDDGKIWNYVSELFPCFWGKTFIHNGELYMLSVNTEYGDLLIGKLPSARNLLSLLTSPDCKNWTVARDLLDYRHESADEVGFQYVNMQFDGEDIVYLCRTAINGAHNFHDSNYSTFHRIANFRRYSKNEQK
ncbi:MAG: hypothetical protein IJX06_00300 [Clostridia bacterium]|nr:hypothetical protein [Clostridia bacterium]